MCFVLVFNNNFLIVIFVEFVLLIMIFILFICLLIIFNVLIIVVKMIIVVLCWLLWNIGIFVFFFNCFLILK